MRFIARMRGGRGTLGCNVQTTDGIEEPPPPPHAHGSSSSQPGHWGWLPAALLISLYLMPVWAFPFVPTQDGPSHLSNAALLLDYGRPGTNGEHGGYVQTRLAPLGLMVGLACLRMPSTRVARAVVPAALGLLLAVNLASIALHFKSASADLAEYAAALQSPQLEGHLTLATTRERDGRAAVDHLHHALELYCILNDHISLQNYDARTHYFPIKYRVDVPLETAVLLRDRKLAPDVVFTWNQGGFLKSDITTHYREVFRGGRLQIFKRRPARHGAGNGDQWPQAADRETAHGA
jgi:hypothetical protein